MSFKHYSAAPGLGLNYSLYAVPAGWVVSMAPLWWAIAKTEKLAPGAYNNAMPKESWAKIGDKIPGDVSRKITRAVDANNNNHVNLPLFAAAIIAGNIAGVDVKTLHACAAGWLASRVAYNLSYVLIEDPTWAYVRTGLYFAGLGSCFTLFVKAANRMKGLPL